MQKSANSIFSRGYIFIWAGFKSQEWTHFRIYCIRLKMNQTVHTLLDEVRAYLKSQFHERAFFIQNKSEMDLVTEVDLTVEKMIQSQLKKNFPDIAMLSEEDPSSHTLDLKQPTWILDPLDGTINFAHGFPLFCVSLALVENHQTTHAWIDVPMLNLRYTSEKGKGSFCNGVPISVSKRFEEKNAMVGVAQPPIELDSDFNLTQAVSKNYTSLRRTGTAVFNFTQVSHGAFDFFYGSQLQIWDIAAGTLLVTEAGGKLFNLDLSPFGGLHQQDLIACSGNISLTPLI